MELTNDNYFEDKEFLNHSTLKLYKECSSKALFTAKGEYKQDFSENEAILVGTYVDSAIEGTLEDFLNRNPQVFLRGKRENGLKKAFEDAKIMIDKINKDTIGRKLLTGEKQVILTGEIEGIKVKCKIDNINFKHKFFTDFKTCRDIFETTYDVEQKQRVSFIESRGYLTQLAFYREIIRQNTNEEFIACIVAYDKTENTKGLSLQFAKEEIDNAFEDVKELLKQHKKALEGEVHRCERCDYCNSTRTNSLSFTSYQDFLEFIG